MKFAAELIEKIFYEETFVTSTPCWEYVKELFSENVSRGESTTITFLIYPNDKATVSINSGTEKETSFSRKELFDIKSIAEVNGLLVSHNQFDENETASEFIEFCFTSPNKL